MRRGVVLVALWASLLPAFAVDRMPLEEFQTRRVALRKSLDGVLVLFGRISKEDNDLFGSRQESNFYYLTGWEEPDAILLLTPGEQILFLPARNERSERYTGRKTTAEDDNARAITGFESVMPRQKFESQLLRLAESSEKIYTLPDPAIAEKLKPLIAFHQMANAAPAIARLRMVKSPREIDLLQKAVDITIEGHRAAWARLKAGLYEYQLSTTLMTAFFEHGCERPAYPNIVGSGPNSVVLHYSKNTRRVDRGELVVMDAGAECSSYAADITRTAPVGGKFSPRQREIYEIVLGAQKAAIAAVKPGMLLAKTAPNGLYQIAFEYINTHGKDLHGKPLGSYFLHGLGHQIGLDVHDADDTALPLAAGMVVTIEPGIYIAEENIGIRIEDMVLVTEKGGKVMSAALPRETHEIERAVAH